MSRLNFHHLHYFWAVAREGNLTRAAKQLHVSQSALSTQIKALEEQLGHPLFLREGRKLILTEAGRIALSYADTIFATGNELLATLREGRPRERQVLRIGAVATLSRNFQKSFVRPLLAHDDIELVLQSGSLTELLAALGTHRLDMVLSNRAVHGDAVNPWRCQRIARQQVSLVGAPRGDAAPFRWPQDVDGRNLILPSNASAIRAGFEQLCDQAGIRFRVVAEVDDMAMVRLLARKGHAPAVVPTVVVRDELRGGVLEQYCVIPNLYEHFFAITIKRHYQHPLLKTLLSRSEADMLDADPAPDDVAPVKPKRPRKAAAKKSAPPA